MSAEPNLVAFRLWALPILARHGITEPRDSDRDPEGAETGTGSVGEADRARAEGIAQPLDNPPALGEMNDG